MATSSDLSRRLHPAKQRHCLTQPTLLSWNDEVPEKRCSFSFSISTSCTFWKHAFISLKANCNQNWRTRVPKATSIHVQRRTAHFMRSTRLLMKCREFAISVVPSWFTTSRVRLTQESLKDAKMWYGIWRKKCDSSLIIASRRSSSGTRRSRRAGALAMISSLSLTLSPLTISLTFRIRILSSTALRFSRRNSRWRFWLETVNVTHQARQQAQLTMVGNKMDGIEVEERILARERTSKW